MLQSLIGKEQSLNVECVMSHFYTIDSCTRDKHLIFKVTCRASQTDKCLVNLQGAMMLPFLIPAVLLFHQSHGTLEDSSDITDLFQRLQKIESNILNIKDDLEDCMARLEVEDPELEDRVAKLEDLAKIGTLRSCYEYSQYGLKTSGPYMIDPDGGLIGQEPFQVLVVRPEGSNLHSCQFCRFTVTSQRVPRRLCMTQKN